MLIIIIIIIISQRSLYFRNFISNFLSFTTLKNLSVSIYEEKKNFFDEYIKIGNKSDIRTAIESKLTHLCCV